MIDTLSYVLPTDLTRSLNGTHNISHKLVQTTVSTRQYLYSVYTPDLWLKYLITPNWIRLIFDCGTSLPGVRCYSMTPGYWLPRQADVGWARRFSTNKVEHFGTNCLSMGVRPGPYTMGIISAGAEDLGGDVKVQSCLQVGYHYIHGAWDEVFTYARGFGLVKWEKPALNAVSIFNKIRPGMVSPHPVCGVS